MTAITTTNQSQRQPKYTAAELSSHFLSFYQFLTTLHYTPTDLKVPPPTGWPQLSSPTHLASWNLHKSPFVLQVLAHLPYFAPRTGSDANNNPGIHYKSALIDYTSFTSAYFARPDGREAAVNLVNAAGDPVDSMDGFCIAWGRESGGRTLWLNVVDGEIIEESLRCETVGAFDVVEYFDRMRTAYRELKLIPGKGMITMEVWDVDERRERIAVEEVLRQTNEGATDLDWQFVRQVYRDCGWPDALRGEEAAVRVEELLREVWGEERYVLEGGAFSKGKGAGAA